MGRVLSTIVAVVLLLGLGALAVLALPGAGAPMTASPVAAAPLAAEPDAPAAGTDKLNVIAMPLQATNPEFTSVGFNAAGLAAVTGPGVKQVLTWNAPVGSYRTYYPSDPESDNFPLVVGGVYRLILDSTANTVVSFVGNVPDIGAVSFSLTRPVGTGCAINDISVPLNRSDLIDASALAGAIGNVSQVIEWNATAGSNRTYYPSDPESDNFPVKIGYPYRLCLLAGGATQWP